MADDIEDTNSQATGASGNTRKNLPVVSVATKVAKVPSTFYRLIELPDSSEISNGSMVSALPLAVRAYDLSKHFDYDHRVPLIMEAHADWRTAGKCKNERSEKIAKMVEEIYVTLQPSLKRKLRGTKDDSLYEDNRDDNKKVVVKALFDAIKETDCHAYEITAAHYDDMDIVDEGS